MYFKLYFSRKKKGIFMLSQAFYTKPPIFGGTDNFNGSPYSSRDRANYGALAEMFPNGIPAETHETLRQQGLITRCGVFIDPMLKQQEKPKSLSSSSTSLRKLSSRGSSCLPAVCPANCGSFYSSRSWRPSGGFTVKPLTEPHPKFTARS